MKFSDFKKKLRILLEPKGKVAFIESISSGSTVLDVGCGNNSVSLFKSISPGINYTGIDIEDYNINSDDKSLMDRYIITSPEDFHDTILNSGTFDHVVCSHNLEHCNDWRKVVNSICAVIKPGGRLYISTPSIKTLNFPSRKGTLNFYDDSTHTELVNFNDLEALLKSSGFEINYYKTSDKPFLFYLVGLFNEIQSRLKNTVLRGTWAYWGFEARVWATKSKTS